MVAEGKVILICWALRQCIWRWWNPKSWFMIIATKNTEKRKVEERVSGIRNQRNVRGIIPKKSYSLYLISPKVLFYDFFFKIKKSGFLFTLSLIIVNWNEQSGLGIFSNTHTFSVMPMTMLVFYHVGRGTQYQRIPIPIWILKAQGFLTFMLIVTGKAM